MKFLRQYQLYVNDTNSDLQGIGEGIIDEEDASTQALSNDKIQLQLIDKEVRFACLLDLLIWGYIHLIYLHYKKSEIL